MDDTVVPGFFTAGNVNAKLSGPNDPELATAFHHSSHHPLLNVPPGTVLINFRLLLRN